MREFNLLEEYPKLNKPRYISETTRTITNRIIASRRDEEFFDGDRNNGYGGYVYDGRWVSVANKISKEYMLNESSKFLHINSEKGFLLHDFLIKFPKMKCVGIETSDFAIKNSIQSEN